MDPVALALVLSGSVFHLGWNAITKKASDRLAFLWMVLAPQALVGVGGCAYLLFWAPISATGWICLLASGVVHAIYFWALAQSYDRGDLSFVYPYCRAIGAALTVLGGVVLFGERPSALGWVGIALTLGSTLLEPLFEVRAGGWKTLSGGAFLWAGATGVAIAGYLLIDKVGVAHVPAFPYLAGFVLVATVLLAPRVLRGGRVRAERLETGWTPAFAAAFLGAAYLLILLAMKIAPVGYVVAARATGIVLSGLVGWAYFKEEVRPIRRLAIAGIAAGIVCIGLA